VIGSEIGRTPGGQFLHVAVGQWQACGIYANGALDCWMPVADPIPSGTFTQLDFGSDYVCAIRTDGTLACFRGMTASGPDYGITSPPPGTFTRIATGAVFACGVRTDGTLACWGEGKKTGDCATDLDQCGMAASPAGTFTEVACATRMRVASKPTARLCVGARILAAAPRPRRCEWQRLPSYSSSSFSSSAGERRQPRALCAAARMSCAPPSFRTVEPAKHGSWELFFFRPIDARQLPLRPIRETESAIAAARPLHGEPVKAGWMAYTLHSISA
jgi:hypothetical protein